MENVESIPSRAFHVSRPCMGVPVVAKNLLLQSFGMIVIESIIVVALIRGRGAVLSYR